MRLCAMVLGALLCVAPLFVSLGGPVHAKGHDIFPLAKVERGAKGYGLTVFQGTTPERFEFEVVGVIKNFLPKMDIILVRSDDPKLKESGFAQGMSGSPLFLEDKLVCAFSYGFRFNRAAIGGCTPIETMIQESRTPVRGPEATALASSEEWHRQVPLERFERGRDLLARPDAPRDSWLTQSPLPTLPEVPPPDSALVRAGVPLSVSGLGPTALEAARRLFSPYGLEPMQAGGGGSEDRGPSRFELGAPLGVVLARGDFSVVATGTVSYVDGDKVLAFGHPMLQMGEAYMPVSSAEIHTILPSAMMAFKLSSPLRVLGSLVQDRQSMIMADATRKADLMPVDVRITGPSGREQTFHAEVVRNRFLTPQLALMAVTNAAQVIAPDITDCTLTLESRVQVKGLGPLRFVDYIYSAEGASGNALATARGLRMLTPLLFNPWSPITIERVDVKLDVQYKANVMTIQSIRLPDSRIPYGKSIDIEVVMQPYGDKPYVERIPIAIPERLAGATIRLEVTSGDTARLDMAPPESLEQLVNGLRTRTFPGNVIVATLYTPEEGVMLGGRIVPNLPDSVLDTVRPAASTIKPEAYKATLREIVPTRRVVRGKQEITFTVKDRSK